MTLDERLDQIRDLNQLLSRVDREIHVAEEPFKKIAREHSNFEACCELVQLEMGGRSTESSDLYFEWRCHPCGTDEGFYVPIEYFSSIT